MNVGTGIGSYSKFGGYGTDNQNWPNLKIKRKTEAKFFPLVKKLEPKLNPIFEKTKPKPNQNQSLRKCYELELRGPPGWGELANTG